MLDRYATDLRIVGVPGLPEITTGDDLAALIAEHATGHDWADGDVVVVTSKVVAKAQGLLTTADPDLVLAAQTDRVVARRGLMSIARTRHGLTLANAGIDHSNTPPGTVLPLPPDPDAAARALRAALQERVAVRLAVVVTDTAGRAWRLGQTDQAIGVAGLTPLLDLSGDADIHGTILAVTAPAVADAVAAAADLAKGKVSGTPVAIATGLAALVTDDDGPGAAALVRPEDTDLFGYGAADAVRAAALRDNPAGWRGFARDDGSVGDLVTLVTPSLQAGMVDAVQQQDPVGGGVATIDVRVRGGAPAVAYLRAGMLVERLAALATASRRRVDVETVEQPGRGPDPAPATAGDRTTGGIGWIVVARVVVSEPDDPSSGAG
ncbi:MAG: coenzyme F420-0:L-glutamate ligase [Nocardioidaceae bacterium]